MRRLIPAIIAALAVLVAAPAPAHAVCNDDPNQCARIVHSVYSDVSTMSVTRIYPAQAGYIESMARGTGGTYAGYYIPACYQALMSNANGSWYQLGPAWRSVGIGGVTYVVDLQRRC